MVYNNLIKGAKNEKENFHDSCLCRILPFLRHGTRKGICASLQTPFLLERLFRGGGDAERLYFLHALRRGKPDVPFRLFFAPGNQRLQPGWVFLLGVFDRQGRGHYHAEAYPVSQYEYYDVFCYYGKPSFNPRAEDYLECRFSSFERELNGGFSSKEILWSVVEDTEEMYEISFTYHEIPIFTATAYGEARCDISPEVLSQAILSDVKYVY